MILKMVIVFFGSYDNEAYVKANGTVLTETQMQTQSAFTGFDFKNTWEMDPNSTYKYPQLKKTDNKGLMVLR